MKALVILLSLLALISLLGSTAVVNGSPIAFDFKAVVASVEQPVFPTVNVGDLVVGKYFFESSTPDSDPNPARGVYLSSGHFDARIGTLSFSFPLSLIEVLDNFSGPDRYTVAAMSGNTLLELTLFDAANSNPFTNDSLPLVPPSLGRFDDSKQFQVFVRNPPDPDFISKIAANVVTLVVPEPSALILLMSGLAWLGAWRKRWPQSAWAEVDERAPPRLPLLLPERLAGGMEADHQAAREEERDLGARLAADCARLQGRIL